MTALKDAVRKAPRPAVASEGKKRLAALIAEAAEREVPLGGVLEGRPETEALLVGLADHSSFLWRLAQDAERLLALLEADPDARFDALVAEAAGSWATAPSDPAFMRGLRKAKQEAALLIAMADIGGIWSVERVTRALSDFADATVSASVRRLLRNAAEEGRFLPKDPADPAQDCGFTVLALGKHGARELNYSSDIDVIVLYDPEAAPLREGLEPAPFFVRLTQGLVRFMQERTPDGYVFRTDLRLRPDPGSTPVAISVSSAYGYYESVGQNWERAAMIKARPVAGDIPLGDRFIADLKPFVWRKYFDFAAISDIHAMKRQIHAVRGHEAIAVAGHDIKLGRGGIREIEFFVQTQQLVFGGRRPQLRGQRTLEMLTALREDGWISEEAEHELADAYRFLRTLEHRLQMQEDEQTQRLPSDAKKLEGFARFSGYASTAKFAEALTAEAVLVEKHYARLFEEGPELTASKGGSLVFTGTTDDPETLDTLAKMGFDDPANVAETVRGWHFGRRQAVQSARAREVVTELVPPLLEAFGGSADPDGALAAFDRALARMPAAVELFSILRSNGAILQLFADILGSAPRLAETVAGRPHVLDAVIDPVFVEPFPNVETLQARMAESFGQFELFEDFLDRLRETGQHEIFLVGARMLSGVLSPARAGEAYATVAEAVIGLALDEVRTRFEAEHGRVPGGRLAVLGMGRLGSREMTATSDLDLVVLYDFDPEATESDGGRPLAPTTYFTRLTQRLISALTVPTRKGTLYEVDMRLRPSGNKGPAATQFKGFVDYQRTEAETWEHMALVRARPIAGDASLRADIDAAVAEVLARPRDERKVFVDALQMRRLIAQEKGESKPWDLKLAAGGLVDLEFLSQVLVLTRSAGKPAIAVRNTGAILDAATAEGLIEPNDGEVLRGAYALMRDVFQWQRLTMSGDFDPKSAGAALKRRLAGAAGLPDFKVLESHLTETRGKVRAIFEKMLG
jgi:glutamate-ammonia-ligase adenylyltransferase